MKRNISIDDAVTSLLSCIHPGCIETAALSDALGRVLSEDICARINLPSFNRSAYDGFALKWEETTNACTESPAAFRITETITAGDFSTTVLENGCAVRIMTGAALPQGADCVINFERVSEDGTTLLVSDPLYEWQNVDRIGDEISLGAVLLKKGERLTPSHIGILASQGFAFVPVYQKPKAAILSTGSELQEPGTPHIDGKIYNSNLYVFRALLELEGFQVEREVHLNDEEASITEMLQKLSSEVDLIITTGGASVGDKDFALSALQKAQADILFAHAAIKPGSCCFGASLNNTLILSLSGNPGAALTSYYRIGLPAIRRMTGRNDYMLRECMLPLAKTCAKTSSNPRILKGHTEISGGKEYFAAHEGQTNGMQTSFLHMNALAELPPSARPIAAGTMVRVFFP